MACLIESAVAGSSDPDRIRRPRVADVLRRSPALRSLIEGGRTSVGKQVRFDADRSRVDNVVLKLARGHAAFELGLPCRRQPDALMWWPLPVMSEEQRQAYEASHVTETLGEVGSRGVQRLLVTQLSLVSFTGQMSTLGVVINDWIDVQEERYRYLAVYDAEAVTIRIVIGEYLACHVSWTD